MRILKIKDKEFQVDDDDYEWLSDLTGWHLVGYKGSTNYASLANTRKHHGKTISLHRLILLAEHGYEYWEGYIADHIDRNPFNCQKSNLRWATPQENTWNRTARGKSKARTTSIYTGVIRNSSQKKGGKLYLGNTFNAMYKSERIGTFKTELEAARAYDEVCKREQGNLAVLNFPVDKV